MNGRSAEEIKAIEASLSPTPRCDALEAEYHDRTVKRLRVWKLARQLEREWAALMREKMEWSKKKDAEDAEYICLKCGIRRDAHKCPNDPQF